MSTISDDDKTVKKVTLAILGDPKCTNPKCQRQMDSNFAGFAEWVPRGQLYRCNDCDRRYMTWDGCVLSAKARGVDE